MIGTDDFVSITVDAVTMASASVVNNSLLATSAPTAEPNNTAAIAGGIVASFVFVLVVVAVLRWFFVRQKSKRSPASSDLQPAAQAPQVEYASTFAALQ